MIFPLRLAVAVFSTCVLTAYSSGEKLRGVDPQLRQHYVSSADGIFRCLDGLKTIPFAQVNDDFCDCYDGSDEPGTSACPNGKFYCRNAGHQPLHLNASFVDDGICDCCDGTDELSGKCANRCSELGAETLKALKADIAAAEAGIRAKQKYIAQAGDLKKKWGKRVEELQNEIAQQQIAVDAAAGKRDELQARESELQEQKRKQDESVPKADTPASVEEAAASGGGKVAEEQPSGETPAPSAADAEETPEELARRVASQWIPGAREEGDPQEGGPPLQDGSDEDEGGEDEGHDYGDEDDHDEDDDGEDDEEGDADHADDSEDEGVDAEEGDHEDVDDYSLDEGEEGDMDEGEVIDDDDNDDDDDSAASSAQIPPPPVTPPMLNRPTVELRLPPWAAKVRDWAVTLYAKLMGEQPGGVSEPSPPPAPPAAKSALDLELDALRKELSQARSEFHTQDRKLKSLKTEQEGLQANLERSYGPQDEYAALVDKCIDAKVDKYSYEVCPFGSATQKEGHSSTSLGKWEGVGGNFSSMKFTGGQGCWQGPARSMEVALKCGSDEELTRVEEPSRCEYHAELATPAACAAEALQALKAELQAREQALEEASAGHDEL